MTYGCPNKTCLFHKKRTHIKKDGLYFRKSDSRYVKRFKCTHCKKRFSNATFNLTFGQNKRRVNFMLRKLYCSGVSQRRIAKILKITTKTVHRKILYWQKKSKLEHCKLLVSLKNVPSQRVQLDDLITKEQTKLKPLSVSVLVDHETRKILGCEVSQIPAFGHLSGVAKKKYGLRTSNHRDKLHKLLKVLKPVISRHALFESDDHKTYPEVIREHFPKAQHVRYKSIKGAIVGQGELKRAQFDPLFPINHTLAMLRANMSRLFRRSWCLSQKASMLQAHLDIFIDYFNTELV